MDNNDQETLILVAPQRAITSLVYTIRKAFASQTVCMKKKTASTETPFLSQKNKWKQEMFSFSAPFFRIT
jgi:hypothetical protein